MLIQHNSICHEKGICRLGDFRCLHLVSFEDIEFSNANMPVSWPIQVKNSIEISHTEIKLVSTRIPT